MLCTEYLAGFFDGEGSIGIYPVMHHGRPGFYLRTQLVQNIGEASVALLAELTTVYGAPPSSQQSLRASASPTQLSLFHPTCTSAVQVVHTLRLSGR